jgi:diadenosine tetraphosphate (Ap4A) HIT family hydrolase
MDDFGFILDPAFEATSVSVGKLPLCEVRLQADARWPWLVLIPQKRGLREIEDLNVVQRGQLIEEAVAAGAAVRAVGGVLGLPVEKLNLGALGNVTPQLHLHLVGRRAGDPAWPGPVWGVGAAQAYPVETLAQAVVAARSALNIC